MKLLRILLIICFICLAIFVIIRHHSQDRTFEHSLSNSGNKPLRIVSLAPNLTEILFALGLSERIIAVSSDSDYPSEAANKNKVGTFWAPNIEAIIASKPDLVITLGSEQQESVAESLKRLGYEVLILKTEKIEELFTAIDKIGVATDCELSADQMVKSINDRLNDLQQEFASIAKVRVLWVVQTEPLRVAGRNTFINELVELAGGENAIGPTIAKYPQIGAEELLTCGVEIIIQSAMGAGNISAQQKAAEMFWSKWSSLSAVENSRIYVIEPDTTLRLGPRLPQGAETIARCLHPDSFGRTDDIARLDE